jgi:hypothetical protein
VSCQLPQARCWGVVALSELMPTRIRSNGMSIALLLNQGVSTTIAAIFLPAVAKSTILELLVHSMLRFGSRWVAV